MQGMYSTRSPAVKRLMKEAQELREPTEQYHAQPLEDNLFEWHFTIRGPGETEFEEGIYHGRIILPPEYPMKPPSIILLTPNGRFEVFKKICLSISGHHPESWQPSWSIRTALLAIIGFMPSHGGGAIGSLDYPSDERKRLAKRSLEWKCSTCGNVHNILKPVTAASKETAKEAKELASQINFQAEKQAGGNNKETTTTKSSTETTATSATTEVPSPTVTSHANQSQFPFQAGQNPFLTGQANFCFPPPFMSMPNMTQHQSSNLPPRFPPPPPFIPAMFPPGFMQGMSVHGNMPSMPSWQGQPFTNQNLNSGTQHNATGGQESQTTIPPNSASRTTTVPETIGASNANSTPEVRTQTSEVSTSVSDSQNLNSGNVSQTTNNTSTVSDGNSSKKDSETKTDPENGSDPRSVPQTISDTRTDPQNSSDARSASQNNSDTRTVSQNESSTGSNVRQRLVEPTRRVFAPGHVGQNAELPQERQSGGSVSLIIIAVLGLAILALLIRRFYLSRYWRYISF
ncbi:hypothetical protein KUTeg_007894 [Tegillarca granosa]|uniref:UBC core domain-containing protein n=1 Tax=Tegillarca granosa TaxID=220873 RepID=A0ABQ9FEJ6_TEGGR|nr:hypothetical protein KUTeg_007894 [Tegillarca granosa]